MWFKYNTEYCKEVKSVSMGEQYKEKDMQYCKSIKRDIMGQAYWHGSTNNAEKNAEEKCQEYLKNCELEWYVLVNDFIVIFKTKEAAEKLYNTIIDELGDKYGMVLYSKEGEI